MKFNEFVDAVKNGITDICGPEFTVNTFRALKNNSVELIGLSIMETGTNIAPTIYLDDFYTDFCDGMEMGEILNKIIRIYSENRTGNSVDVDIFRHYDNVKNEIVFKLVSYDKNKELLEKVPHRRIMDLAIIYCVFFGKTEMGNATVTIYNDHMKIWGADENELYDAAMKNTYRLLAPEISSMNDVLRGLLGERDDVSCEDAESLMREEEECPMQMFVISNSSHLNGAGCILYKGLLDKFAENMGTDLYIIPSSIHEVIAIPAEEGVNEDDLEEMIADVNCTQVSPEEVLSDRLYYFSREKSELQCRYDKSKVCTM